VPHFWPVLPEVGLLTFFVWNAVEDAAARYVSGVLFISQGVAPATAQSNAA
jgi:hypothetical protein